jgi:tetratricopeptide (TPR) repeat protein
MDEQVERIQPRGDAYEWYIRGVQLLDARNPAAAAALLEHAVRAEPASRSAREALARAQFDSGSFALARDNFAAIVADNPTDDYALFGLGLAAARLQCHDEAVEHLALAAAMRPDNKDYAAALRRARVVRSGGEFPS